jgi:membrane-bound lytic murein transglycosylase B
MLKHVLVLVFVFVAAGVFGPPPVKAQTAAPAQAAAPPFNPGFADLMNTLVQPRHAKLGLSAREQNWALARYAAHELKDSLAKIARWRPRFREQSVPDMMEATTGEPIKAIEGARRRQVQRRLHTVDRGLQFLSCRAQPRVHRDQGARPLALR